MDIEFARSIYPYWMMLFMGLFIGIAAWAYWPSRRRRRQMDDYASIPFRDDEDKRDGAR